MNINKEEIENKVKEMVSKGAKASKEALAKAGDKVQDFTDKSMIKIEKRQLETKRDCKYEELGLKLSQLLLEGATINSSNAAEIAIVNDLQKEILTLSEQIAQKDQIL